MDIVIKINCDNAAFEGYPGREVAHILRQTAETLSYHVDWFECGYDAPLRDSNGNKVGICQIIK